VPLTRRALKPRATDGRRVDRSDCTRIWVLVLTVVVSAMQIGKVPPALSLLREDLSVGLVASAWILSMFSALGALFRSVAGSPPILAALGSRPLWELNAALLAGLALAVAWSNSRPHTVSARHSTQFGAMLRASLLRPGTLLLAAVAAAVGDWHASALVLLPVAAFGLSASSCQRTSPGVSCRPNIGLDWRPCCQAAAVRISWQRGNDTDVSAEVPIWHYGEALASVTYEV
jgi:hypothetical protein